MTPGGRTVGLASLPMVQCHTLHAAQVGCTLGVAACAPPGPRTHAGVVIHALTAPRHRTGVTGIAVHGRAVQQLCLRYMVRRFGQRSTAVALGHEIAVVTRLATGRADHRVIHGH